MNRNKTARAIMGALNLFAVASPLLTAHSAQAKTSDQKMEKLNAASFKSIERSWLAVPNACKARGFNSDPVSIKHHEISAQIKNIYASFEA